MRAETVFCMIGVTSQQRKLFGDWIRIEVDLAICIKWGFHGKLGVTVFWIILIALSCETIKPSKEVGKSWGVLERKMRRKWVLEVLNLTRLPLPHLEIVFVQFYSSSWNEMRCRSSKRMWSRFEGNRGEQSWVISVWANWVIAEEIRSLIKR